MDQEQPMEIHPSPAVPPAEDDGQASALAAAVECLLFVADRPIPPERLAEALGAPVPAVREALEHLRRRLADGGLMLQAVAGGYQLATRPEHADCVRRFLQKEHGERLTRGALETLAVIAYRQPVTRGEIEQIRGVRSDWHIERLLERQLIREVGRRPSLGRPVLFGTTDLFLRYFGLRDLSDLPPMGDRGVGALLDVRR
ncbi:MAG: SMC-Scp complex subunit ScpB [Armatimonadota bacterium]|nr:SMC-Scp complex subunit ScpB [Armatimonadota bacterium]MDR7520171.1 SMC-Scp complex subunit ScpB [Armatimonadota bacterium]MDR7549246.1 SMC-Scp complex subunit ScpB [Armatimonadota bacterium]